MAGHVLLASSRDSGVNDLPVQGAVAANHSVGGHMGKKSGTKKATTTVKDLAAKKSGPRVKGGATHAGEIDVLSSRRR